MITPASPSAWAADRPKKKGPENYNSRKESYGKFISGNELIGSTTEDIAVNTRTITLLTTDVKKRKLIGVSKELMAESLKSVSIRAKILVQRLVIHPAGDRGTSKDIVW